MNLTTDKGPCNIELRQSCKAIAIFLLFGNVLSAIIVPGTLTQSKILIGLIIIVLGNLSLLYGTIKENEWMLLPWLLLAIPFFIGWPIAVLGVIFNLGGYRQAFFDSVLVGIMSLIIALILYLYWTRLVFSYFKQLRDRTSKPRHNVVV